MIETARLRLRAPVDADIDAIFEYASDPAVTALMDWRCLSERREAEDFRARTEKSWRAGDEHTWVIAELGPDSVIGAVSLRLRKSDADLGYVLNQRFWNRGYATEAAAAVVSWAVNVRRVPRIWAICDIENHRSMRVLSKLGLAQEGLAPWETVRPNLSQLPRSSYLYGKRSS